VSQLTSEDLPVAIEIARMFFPSIYAASRYSQLTQSKKTKQIPYLLVVEDRVLGEGLARLEYTGKSNNPSYFAPHNQQYMCRDCGKMWMKLLVNHPEASWECKHSLCAEHRGGSILGTLEYANLTLPLTKELALYELELYLRDTKLYPRRNGFDLGDTKILTPEDIYE
jgi:hypothetical protein